MKDGCLTSATCVWYLGLENLGMTSLTSSIGMVFEYGVELVPSNTSSSKDAALLA